MRQFYRQDAAQLCTHWSSVRANDATAARSAPRRRLEQGARAGRQGGVPGSAARLQRRTACCGGFAPPPDCGSTSCCSRFTVSIGPRERSFTREESRGSELMRAHSPRSSVLSAEPVRRAASARARRRELYTHGPRETGGAGVRGRRKGRRGPLHTTGAR